MSQKNKKTMKMLPESERPYEKALELGVSSLSDAELLAVILRTGTKDISVRDLAEEILKLGNPPGLPGLLRRSMEDYKEIKGIGTVKAIQLSCIGELSQRIWKSEKRVRSYVRDHPESVAEYYMEEMRHMEQEVLKLLILNVKNVILQDVDVSRGTADSTYISPREIFIEAMRYRGTGLIMLHNHPSGDPSPSEADLLFTKRVKTAGSLIGIPLIDHIIIGDNSYVSLKERGIM